MKTHTIKIKVGFDFEDTKSSKQSTNMSLKDINIPQAKAAEENALISKAFDSPTVKQANQDGFASIGRSSFASAKPANTNANELQKIL